jgi:hypothetical protein
VSKKIFELFGHRLDDWTDEAAENRSKAWCPFMGAECDGGGNRYSSAVDLEKNAALRAFFPNKTIVQAGVCSLRLSEGGQPWIVCPRRLFSLKRSDGYDYQNYIKKDLTRYACLEKGKSYRSWSEVKMKLSTKTEDDQEKYFDYSFDYIIAGSQRIELSKAADLFGFSDSKTRMIAEKNGFTLASRDRQMWIDDFPSGPIVIVEVMTSSTSGGDKKKRSQIAMAFEDAVINGQNHLAPGINYRQVWARMVSQLIVKSQVGLSWGGKTIWVLQDVLTDYISESTALDLSKYLAENPDQVNILAFGYGDLEDPNRRKSVIEIKDGKFYSGPISSTEESKNSGGFVDIVKIGAAPPISHLWKSLFVKPPSGLILA